MGIDTDITLQLYVSSYIDLFSTFRRLVDLTGGR